MTFANGVPLCRGKILYSEMYDMLKNMDPPLGFGGKCPNRLAYKKLIRMNMPLDKDMKVHFTTTLFALIRENLSIKVRSGTCVRRLFQFTPFTHCVFS
jgi:voltage-dependent calcium channel N type alpha-1B